MNIVFLLPNLAGGGAESRTLCLAKTLHQLGHTVHLFLLQPQIDYIVPPEIPCHTLSEKIPSLWRPLRYHYYAHLLKKQLANLEKKASIDLLVGVLFDAHRVLHHINHPRTVYSIRNTLSLTLEKLKIRSKFKALKRYYDYHRIYTAKPLITVSQACAEDLINPLKIRPLWIKTLYNPFDFNEIKNLSLITPEMLPTKPYLIHIGRFTQQKRHDLLLAAFSKLPPDYLLILLTKPEKALHELIAHYQLTERVILPGFQKNPYPWIKGARLLILCSDHEGLPGVLIESLALGTPVVSTDCKSGPREILKENLSNCLVPTNNPEALTEKIQTLLKTPPNIPENCVNLFSNVSVANLYIHLIKNWGA
jgi:glycosyltransferase involved in cell wall biosynthesis